MRSLKKQFILVFGLFMLVSLSVIAIVSGIGIMRTGEILASQQGIPVVQKATAMIDGDEFEKFVNGNPSESDSYYEETRLALLEI